MKSSFNPRFLRVIFFGVTAGFGSLVQTTAFGSHIVEGEKTDAQVDTGTAANPACNQTLMVGNLYGTDNTVMVEPFCLPYLPPGQTITSVSLQFYYQGANGTPTFNAALYGLNRTNTNSAPLVSDYYLGSNDTQNTLLNAAFITPSTTAGQVLTYTSSSLKTFVVNQYAAFPSGSDFSARYIFFRLSPTATQVNGYTNYMVSGANHQTRAWRPELIITTSGGITAVAGRLQFSFTLDQNYVTSAGVYTTNNTLIRTLWNNQLYQAGVNYAAWDGLDDNGVAMAAGTTYQIKMICHNVQYVWEGIIGNTSDNQTGPNVFRAAYPISSMSIAGGRAYYSVGYDEAQTPFNYFNTASPQAANGFLYNDPFSVFNFVATDGTHAYWAKVQGGVSASNTYILGTNNSDGSVYTFPQGQAITGTNQKWSNGIDLDTTAGQPNGAGGLAVQVSGKYLFVSHPSLNLIRVFDKVQGNLVGSFSVTSPGVIACNASGNLWVVCKSGTAPVIEKFNISSAGAATLALTISSGLVNPVGLGTSPDGSTLAVTDSGSSQQVKAFSDSTGALLWTYGQLGGNLTQGPAITNNCFNFTTQSYVAYQSDGTMWVGDPGNQRNLHFSLSGTTLQYINQIAYSIYNYNTAVDVRNPTRVFNQFLEYSVNYAVQPGGTNGSWSLVKNWAYGLPSNSKQLYTGFANGLNCVVTLPNGRTYGLLENYANGKTDLVELPASGPLRITGYEYSNYPRIYADGTLRYNVVTASSNQFYEQPLTGFDSTGNPHWGSPILIASSAVATGDPVVNGGRVEVTSSGVVASFSPDKTNTGFHLGGILLGGNQWLWRSSPSTTAAYTGPMPTDGHFDIGNGVNYAAKTFVSYDRNIIYNYHGELWKQNEASQWMNYFDDGLMVGQFGTLGIYVPCNQAVAGFAGNSFAPSMVSYNGKVYLYHNDESNHGGIHRWRIDGLDQIKEISTSSTLGNTASLTTVTSGVSGSLVTTNSPNPNLASNGLSATITSPPNGAVYVNGLNVTLGVIASSPSGTIVSVQFFDGTTSLGTSTAAPFGLNLSGLSNGPHTLTALATDSMGNTITSAPVTITIESADSKTVPPTPTNLTATSVTSNSVGLSWTEPASQTGVNTLGALVSFNFTPAGGSRVLTATQTAGLPGYTVGYFNNLTPGATSRFVTPLDSTGMAVPNLEVDWDGSGGNAGYSTANFSGGAYDLFYDTQNTLSSATAVTVNNVPYALYDVIIYSLPDGLQFGAQSSSLSLISGFTTTTIQQNFTVQPTSYAAATFAQGVTQTATDKNTIIITGISTPSFQILGGTISAFQIVERPPASGIPTAFSLQRQIGTGAFTQIASLSGSTSTYTDASLSTSTSYIYRLMASDAIGTSGYSNTLNVTTNSTPTPSFTTWEASYFNTTQMQTQLVSSASATPENDHTPNLLKYLFDINPSRMMTASDRAALPTMAKTVVAGTPYLTLTYRQNPLETGLAVNVQTSTTLTTWATVTPDLNQVVGTDATTGDNMVQVGVKTNNATRLFIRLNVVGG